MSKHTMIALILMVFFVVVLLLCRGSVNIPILQLNNVNLSFALLGSMIVGVVIGILLK